MEVMEIKNPSEIMQMDYMYYLDLVKWKEELEDKRRRKKDELVREQISKQERQMKINKHHRELEIKKYRRSR